MYWSRVLVIITVLIDTWWNVNDYLLDCFAFYYQVLIDTWWNVNFQALFLHASSRIVLIDTWWNVNILSAKLCWVRSSFNRYMVECEFFVDVHDVCCRVVVLIDTWWNVN